MPWCADQILLRTEALICPAIWSAGCCWLTEVFLCKHYPQPKEAAYKGYDLSPGLICIQYLVGKGIQRPDTLA